MTYVGVVRCKWCGCERVGGGRISWYKGRCNQRDQSCFKFGISRLGDIKQSAMGSFKEETCLWENKWSGIEL